jgi:hypothetical protein
MTLIHLRKAANDALSRQTPKMIFWNLREPSPSASKKLRLTSRKEDVSGGFATMRASLSADNASTKSASGCNL